MLVNLHERVQQYTGPFELSEPDDELRRAIATIAEQEIRQVPTR